MEPLPPAATLHTLQQKEKERVFDVLFEPCPTLRSLGRDICDKNRFSSYNDFIATVGKSLHALAQSESLNDTEALHCILRSHPRLGANRVESVQSQAEQAQLQTANHREALVLAELNELYERTFPGLCYVTFVNGRPRSVIMQDIRHRIQRSEQKQEEVDAINAMCEIALDRARKLAA